MSPDRLRLVRALAAALGVLSVAGVAQAQDALVVSTRAEGVEIATTSMPDLQPGARVGFVRPAEARREVGSGFVLSVSAGRAVVGLTPGGEVRAGDVAIRCQGGANVDPLRAAVAQLRDQAQASGQPAGELSARVGVVQTVLQARDAAVARGACDLSSYDAQLVVLGRDLQAATAPPAGSPAATPVPGAPGAGASGTTSAPVPGAVSVVGAPVPGAPAPGSPGAASLPGQPVPSGSGGDVLSKVADGVQSLLGKFLGGGGGGGSAPSFSGSAPPPQPTSGSTASPPPSLGGGAGGGVTGNPGSVVATPRAGGPGGLVPASPTGPSGRATIAPVPSQTGLSSAPPPAVRRPVPTRRPGWPGPGGNIQAP